MALFGKLLSDAIRDPAVLHATGCLLSELCKDTEMVTSFSSLLLTLIREKEVVSEVEKFVGDTAGFVLNDAEVCGKLI